MRLGFPALTRSRTVTNKLSANTRLWSHLPTISALFILTNDSSLVSKFNSKPKLDGLRPTGVSKSRSGSNRKSQGVLDQTDKYNGVCGSESGLGYISLDFVYDDGDTKIDEDESHFKS